MLDRLNSEKTVFEILLQSLEGGHYNIEALKNDLHADSSFAEIGIDSLEMVDFYLRIQERFQITIQQEDFDKLTSVGAVQAYIESKQGALEEENRIC
jgi:acyl carrier protein